MQAYQRAKDNEEDEETQIACLLHDIGHVIGLEAGFPPAMDGCGTPDHEGKGGAFLRSLGFSEKVAFLVSQHVNAKRYLVFKHTGYELSEASKITLRFQGGPMTEVEAEKFEQLPEFTTILRMRTYDEQAKIPNLVTPPVSVIGELVEDHVKRYSCPKPRPYTLSPEQLRFYADQGFLIVHNHPVIKQFDLTQAVQEVAALPAADTFPWLVHDELVKRPANAQGDDTAIQRARVENYVHYHDT